MPVSVCDPPAVRTALLENLCSGENSRDQLDRQLVTSAKRVLMTHIEYEETGTFQTNNLDSLKCKYIILNSNKKNQEKESENGSAANKEVLLPKPKRILFPRESVQLGWSNNRRWNPGSGMINMGNTCYLNSTLQALFHVPSLANWLLSDSAHSDTCEDNGGGQGGCIICAMSKTLLACQNSSNPIKPWLVYSKLRFVCRHLVPGRQEDAHEFLRYLVEAMEKSYLSRFKGSKELDQYSKETTPLNQILGGYLRSTVKCLRCGHVSITFQHFQDLLLDIRKANTLDEALESYFACERLEDMGYKCEGCKHKVSATKQFSLERSSSVLCIQLKRFSMMGNKINKHIEFKSKLDLSKFLCKSKSIPLTYRLVAMVTHIGSSQNCGHYTAIGQSNDGSYYQFDDSSVRSLPLSSVLATNAYIMLYELEKSCNLISHTITPQSLSNNTSNNNQHKFISLHNNEKNIKTFTPALKPFIGLSDLELSIKNGNESDSKKGFIGPVMPSESNANQESNKNQNDKINQQHLQKTLGNMNSRSIIMNGSKLVKPSETSISPQHGKSMPLIDKEPETKKLYSLGNIFSLKNSNSVNGNSSVKSISNAIKPQIDRVNKQIQHLKVNGQTNNNTTSNQNVKSLVPYDGSDDSNSEVDIVLKKQETSVLPGWKVSSTKNPAALSPSLNGKTCRSPKKKINSDNEKSPVKNSDSADTVNQLLRMSHQGYSAPVSTWNGGRSHLEKEIAEERREQRKRSVDEMDQGRVKKVKTFHYQGRDNPGYNPFQEYQNSRQNHGSRWHHNGHNRPYNNHHRNSYNNHRGAIYRGRHKPHNQRHGYYRR